MRFLPSWAPLLGLALGLFLLPATAGAAVQVPDGFPPAGTITYDVWRQGSQIGTHSVEFTRDGDKLTVRTRIRIEVKLLFVTVYRFEHDAEEDWIDGKLMRFAAQTDDNGTDRDVLLERDGDKLKGRYKAPDHTEQALLPGDLIVCSLWNPATPDQTTMIEPTKGRPKAVTVVDRGLEKIQVGTRTVEARHYSITGDLRREVWYGPDGEVAQVQYPNKDGTVLIFKLRDGPAAAPDAAPGSTAAKP
ncbi:MAG TPA: DUF6134 family protein [Hypericibacter adhaerens]|jgi:hypothetical protein|uniref:DUF3108 domain-containing protein n=1 Tax=Hypericibacter adhaerens TaxID=2602016 RepID=A0A5J6MUY1_9PROT|nr:DUF6134 family protein [Hypericibacter adhaerens]QEX20555.1 hypothetical protein FRZ61_04720 [Hypericibacter adhaerens]HWA46416.1 DUF6134 family protein [Hypericibacter adhaerens]